jgi:hypothetical protein
MPTPFEELVVETVWAWGFIIGEGLNNLINLNCSDWAFKEGKVYTFPK